MKFKIDSMLMIAGCLVIICFLAKPAWEQVASATNCTQGCGEDTGVCSGNNITAKCDCNSATSGKTYSNNPVKGITGGSSAISLAVVFCYTEFQCVDGDPAPNSHCMIPSNQTQRPECKELEDSECMERSTGSGVNHTASGCKNDGCSEG